MEDNFYNEMYKDLTIATKKIDEKDYFINYEYVELKDINTKSLEYILMTLNSIDVTVYRNISFTKDIFYDKILSDVLKNKDLCKLLYHFVCSNLNYFTGKDDTKFSFNEYYFDSKIVDFEMMDVEQDIIEECITKYLKIKLGIERLKTSREEDIFKRSDNFLSNHLLFESSFDVSLTESAWEFLNTLDSGINYFIEKDGNYLFTNFYKDFKEHFSKTTEPLNNFYRYDLNELLDLIMLTQKKLPDISIYNRWISC